MLENAKESHDLHQFLSSYSAFNLKRKANLFVCCFCLLMKAASHVIFPFPEYCVLLYNFIQFSRPCDM